LGNSEAGSAGRSAVDAQSREPKAVGEAGTEFVWTRIHTITLVVLCLAAFLDAIDITVVNVALPNIKERLGFSESSLAWVVNAYLILFGGFLLLGGRVGTWWAAARSSSGVCLPSPPPRWAPGRRGTPQR